VGFSRFLTVTSCSTSVTARSSSTSPGSARRQGVEGAVFLAFSKPLPGCVPFEELKTRQLTTDSDWSVIDCYGLVVWASSASPVADGTQAHQRNALTTGVSAR
jgi:hypothetical protein